MLKIEIEKVTKNFKPGDNVTVIRGMHSGESGIVTKNENNKSYVFSDFSNKEIQVLSNDLKLSKETGNMILSTQASGSSSLNLKVFDVVSYNNNKNIGMIIQIERDVYKVINEIGMTQQIRGQEIGTKKITKTVQGRDAVGHTIKYDEVLKVIDGVNRGKKGTVKYIYKSSVFLYNQRDF